VFYSKPESGVHVTEMIIYHFIPFQPSFGYSTGYHHHNHRLVRQKQNGSR